MRRKDREVTNIIEILQIIEKECALAHSQTVDKALLLQGFAIVGTAFLI